MSDLKRKKIACLSGHGTERYAVDYGLSLIGLPLIGAGTGAILPLPATK
jgi:hypothetical protein